MRKTDTWTWFGVKKASKSADIAYDLLRKALAESDYSVLGKFGHEATERGEATGWLRTYKPKGGTPETFVTVDIANDGFKTFVAELKVGAEAVAAA